MHVTVTHVQSNLFIPTFDRTTKFEWNDSLAQDEADN